MTLFTVHLSRRVTFVLALWLIGEVLAFAVVAKAIGVSGAIFLGLAASLLGFVMLKRAGAAAMIKLRAAMAGRGPALADEAAAAGVLDDILSVAGALALLVPGFLSDIVGLTLVLPAARRRLAQWAGRGALKGLRRRGATSGAKSGAPTIDLDHGEWSRTDPTAPVTKA